MVFLRAWIAFIGLVLLSMAGKAHITWLALGLKEHMVKVVRRPLWEDNTKPAEVDLKSQN